MKDISVIIVSTVLVNNVLLIQNLGLCPLFGPYKGFKAVNAMSASVFIITLLSCGITWPLYHFVLLPLGIEYYETFAFLLLIAALVQLTDILLKNFLPKIYDSLKTYLPLTATNCMIFGVCEQNIYDQNSFSVSIAYAIATGLAFWLAMFLFNGIRLKIDENDIPKSFKGFPIYFISASILSLAFLGLSGLVEGLFGM